MKIGPLDTGWAKLEEIRAHLIEFRNSGKPSICYLGYDGVANPEYYLASACQQVWVVPQSSVIVHGMMAQALFHARHARQTENRAGVLPHRRIQDRRQHVTEKKFTPAHKEEVEGLLNGFYNQYLTDAAEARGI